ncbi:mu-type opioid receptor, partial [Biomphalaria pfeifferi]
RSSFDMHMLPKRIINTNTSSCLKQFNNRTVNVCDVFLTFSANEWSDRLDDYFDFDVRNFDGTEDPVFVLVKDVQKYFLPVLCILGIFGNIVSIRVFWTKSMRRKSCIVYLIIKCVMDTLFLVSLFIFWLD